MKIKQYTDAQATALALAEEVFVRGTQAGKSISVAVSGGSTPRLLFELMAESPLRESIHWEYLHLYWVDERCVPPTDEQSNYRMTDVALLNHVPLTESQIHRIRGEAEPTSEAQRYTTLVEQALPCTEEGLPVFDYVLLGIGDDGHTSSIFPHQMELLTERIPYVVAQHPGGQQRIALTGPTILAARRIIFHAVGRGKESILRQIAQQSIEARAYPSSYFFTQREDIELYTDQRL